ncbi:hypothetical protein Hdeb2414_s0290g00858691 [Helianthus debilis subsp. tardiflorus]
MKFDLIYIVTNSVMMLLSDLFVSSRCFRHRLGCDKTVRNWSNVRSFSPISLSWE